MRLGVTGIMTGKEFRAKCPLHHDSNPSFSMDIHTGVWICFKGCGSGEFARLVEAILGCNYNEARLWVQSNGKQQAVEQLSSQLAKELGLTPGVTPTSVPKNNWRTYYNSLSENVAPLWFLNRGFTWDTIFHWQIRYDPLNDAIVVPVFWQKNMVGTVTRNTRADLPRYQNSLGIPLSKILFGEILDTEMGIIICEGCLDTLWLWQNGFNAVGLLGSHLSQEQVSLIIKLGFGEVTLALDADEAGRKAEAESVRTLLHAGYLIPQIKLMRFPEGKKDPQDCTPEELTEAFRNRKGLIHNVIPS